MIFDAVIVEQTEGTNEIGLGCTFIATVDKTEKTFQIVGSSEASPMEGKISNDSPIGLAFMGKKPGEEVQVEIPSGQITYTVKEDEAIKEVDEGKAQLALFLNATTVADIEAVVESGEKMPQKSTYFYPKLITGLAINRLI